MSTNYYAHIIPSKEKRQKLHDAIEANDFGLIERLISELYGDIYKQWDSDTNCILGGRVHLGKRSCSWKFLWNPNVFVIRHGHLVDENGMRGWKEEPSTALYTYPLTKKGLHDFIFREDVLIYDEYDELLDKEEFWKMALEWGHDKKDEGWDGAAYEDEHPGHLYPITGELTDLLKAEGYEFTSHNNFDFYSDGLRFAGYTEFS